MNKYLGSCSCGQVQITLAFAEHLSNYAPRACDCDFCTGRKIAYVSPPKAELQLKTAEPLVSQQQGSNQADFLTCAKCEAVIAASLTTETGRIGSLNATLLEDFSKMKPAEVASPKLLAADQKIERWKTLWMPIDIS